MRNISTDLNRRRLAVLLVVALCPFVASLAFVPDGDDQPAFTATLAAQGQTIWEGVYTDEQAKRGELAYERECGACHGTDLMGDGISPALIGSSFFFRWSDLSVFDMYLSIRTTMPQGAPASLSPSSYADISAFILQKNKMPAGDTELPTTTDALVDILITDTK
jgi:cytochrome c